MEILLIGGNGVLGLAIQRQITTHRELYSIQVAKSSLHCFISKHPDRQQGVAYSLEEGFISNLDAASDESDKIAILLAGISNPTAAYLEKNKAYRVNFSGSVKILEQLEKAGYKTIFVSSVEVFPGERIDYREVSSPHPLNWYGNLKFQTESYILNCLNNCKIVRTSWNIPSSQHRVGRDPVEVTYRSLLAEDPKMAVDNFFTPICADDFAQIILELAKQFDQIPRLIHVAGPDPVSRTDFADIILSSSLNKALRQYRKVFHYELFPDIEETRGRINGLSNELLGKLITPSFRNIWDLVKIRTAQLDEIYMEGF